MRASRASEWRARCSRRLPRLAGRRQAVAPLPWSTRIITRSSGCRGPRHKPTSRRPSARPRGSTTPTRTRAMPRPSDGSRTSTRPTPCCPIRTSARSTTASARTGRLCPGRRDRRCRRCRCQRAQRRRQPVRRLRRVRRAGRQRPLRVPHDRRRREFSDFFQAFFGGASEPLRGHGSRPRPAADRRRDLRGHPRRHGPRRERPVLPAGRRARPPRQPNRPPRPSPRSPSTRPITARPGWSRSMASGSRSRSRKGADTGTRIRLTGKAPGGGDLYVVVRQEQDRTFTRRGADLERELPLTLKEALLGGRRPRPHAEGPRPADDPGRHPARPDLPTHRPGHAPLQGRGPRRPLRQGEGRPAHRPVRRTRRQPPSGSSTSPTSPTPAHRET